MSNSSYIKHSYYFLFSLIGLMLIFMGGLILMKNLIGIQPLPQKYPEYYYPSNFDDLVMGYPVKGEVPVVEDPTIGRKRTLTMEEADKLIAEYDASRVEALAQARLNLQNERNDQFSVSITMLLVGGIVYFFLWGKVRKEFLAS